MNPEENEIVPLAAYLETYIAKTPNLSKLLILNSNFLKSSVNV